MASRRMGRIKKTAGRGTPVKKRASTAAPKLLSGGNPQIRKGYGDAPVRAYLAALPGWKRDVARHLHALIEQALPGVQKAVKWNSPLYGMADEGWFLGMHAYTNYMKVTFFRGSSLRPRPPGKSKMREVRYLDVREHDVLDEAQFVAWVLQASSLPGERM